MSIVKHKTFIENQILNIMDKLLELMNKTIDVYRNINNASVRKKELKELEKLASQMANMTKKLTEVDEK